MQFGWQINGKFQTVLLKGKAETSSVRWRSNRAKSFIGNSKNYQWQKMRELRKPYRDVIIRIGLPQLPVRWFYQTFVRGFENPRSPHINFPS
jgi:hypothetical protein